MEPSKRDWKLYREKVSGWQEHYMERLIEDYVAYLNSNEPASTKFWTMEKRMKQDKKTPGVCIGQIENRFTPLSYIEQIFDSNKLIFRYNEKQNQFSLIETDYLLSTAFSGNDIYIFIKEKETVGRFFCRSFFPKEKKDYTIGQPQYTLLFKEKITVSTGEKVIQYDRLTPKSDSAKISLQENPKK